MDAALIRRPRTGWPLVPAGALALVLASVLAVVPAQAPRAADWGLCAPSTLPPPPREGLRVSTLEADSARLRGDGVSVAEGNVILSTPERTITSRRMDYDPEAGRAEASGEVTLREREMYFEGGRLEADLETGRIVMEDATFTHPDSHVRGDPKRIEHERGVTVATGGSFTTCDPGSSAWTVRASSVELDHEAGVGAARNARLSIFKLPVLYTPWISFPLGSERKSGFLVPVYETADNVGTSLTTPYYLNLAPNYDATLRPRATSRRGPVLGGQLRYLTERGTGAFEAEALPEDRVTGDSRSLLSFRHRHRLGRGLGSRLEYARASDVDFLRDLGTGAGVANTEYLGRFAGVEYEIAPVRFRAEVEDFQVLKRTEGRLDPYRVAPRLALETLHPERNRRINIDFRGEVTRFDHHTNLVARGTRVDLRPSAFIPLRSPRGYLLPRTTLHFTGYGLDEAAEDVPRSPTRLLPSFSVDGGLYFDDHEATIGGRRFTHTLEPRLFYARVPYRDQDRLPLFDGGSLTSGYDHMFRENRFSGADRIGDADRLTLALDSRLLDGGREVFGARIGRMQRFRDRRVRLCTAADPDRGSWCREGPEGADTDERRRSTWIGAVRARPHRSFTVGGAIEQLGGESGYRALSLDLRYHPSPERIVNLGYRRFPRDVTSAGLVQESVEDVTESVGISVHRDLGRNVRVLGSASYALGEENTMTEFYAGLEYDSCCLRVRVIAQRYLPGDRIEHERSIMVQIELKGLTGTEVGRGGDRSRIRPIPGHRNPF